MLKNLLILTSVASAVILPNGAVQPVLIIPGDGSNQLEAKLSKSSSTPHFFCAKSADWYRIWLSLTQLVPGKIDCWCDNIQLVVDPTTGRASNTKGVETRVPGWGTTTGFEELDPSVPAHKTAAFYNMVNELVSQLGLQKGVTLVGAPYDFRYTPDSPQGLQQSEVKALIEKTYTAAMDNRVTIISHSMGGLQTKYFLERQSEEWKAKYIRRWIPISAPMTGAGKEFRLFATGDAEGIPGVSAATIKPEQQSYETNHWLLPPPNNGTNGWGDYVFVQTAEKNYTTSNIDEFFDAVGYSVGKKVRPRVQSLIDPYSAPGVEVNCFYSYGVDTPNHFSYSGSPPDFTKPKSFNVDGDGTVPESSLAICGDWKLKQTQPVDVQQYKGLDHTAMITNAKVIQDIVDLIFKN